MTVTAANPVETFVVMAINVEMSAPALDVLFSHRLNGIEVGQIPYRLVGAQFNAIFGAPATDTTTPLGVLLSNALYTAAIAAGVITGTLS